ncbi:MAG: hypothetical protein ACXWQ5_00620 [Ktedonobacterales bacterium]
MEIVRFGKGSVIITLGIGEEATVRGASIDVLLESADNMYRRPMSLEDPDECTVTARRRPQSEYPATD